MSKTAMNTYQRDQKRIAELESQYDFAVWKLEKAEAELEQEVKDAFYDGRDARERAEKAEAKLEAVREKAHEYPYQGFAYWVMQTLNGEGK